MINRLLSGIPFKNRLWIAFSLMIVLSVTAVGWTAYFIAASVIQNNALKLSQDTLNKSSQAFDEKLKRVAQSLNTLFLSSAYEQAMKNTAAGDASSYFSLYAGLQTPFTQMKMNEPLLQHILITTPIGDFYPTDSVRLYTNAFADTEMYERIREDRHAIWIEGHRDVLFSGNKPVVSFVINAIASSTVPDSYIVLNLKEEELRHFLIDEISEWSEGVTIVGADGSTFFKETPYQYRAMLQDPDFAEKLTSGDSGFFMHRFDGRNYLVNYAKSTVDEQWRFITVKPKDEVLSQIGKVKWAMLIVTAACMLLALLMSQRLSSLLAGPLIQLQQLMRRAGNNDLTVRFVGEGSDEVHQVGNQFNRMLEQISELIEQLTTAQKEKHAAEIKALQAQIDPHFLYNTLNTIYWKTKLKKSDEVGEMVIALSRMFQLGLNNGEDLTTVKRELSHVEQYLHIQQRCYQGLFEYRIDAPEDEEFLEHPILKIVLQPLVENSILHGFKDKHEHGHLRIRLFREQDRLMLEVTDNGHGIDRERLESLTNADNSPGGGYALRNIRQRLKLYYEDEAFMNISSEPGKGTTVILGIPWERKEKQHGQADRIDDH
ncbi:sensor histidine kinase [Paenibacillus ginsengihumi]|uniref:sensor histidine kinase n=1 Tax=Paenibacillus ginsengihumi TaxID=431596 RepID=UPI00037AAD2A|nr:sensor histidine kinase [Paenibacillus ginsengihumi]